MKNFDQNGDFLDQTLILDVQDISDDEGQNGPEFLTFALENVPNGCINGLPGVVLVD